LETFRGVATQLEPDVERVASLFPACRFGFQQALREWGGNLSAAHGLDATIEVMVRFELLRGSGRAAQVHLAELRTPNRALTEEVLRAVDTEQDRSTRLKSLELTLDPRTDSAPRFVTAALLGLVWVVMPLLRPLSVARAPHLEGALSVPVATLCAVALSLVRWRYHRALTPLNRQLAAVLIFAWVIQAAGLLSYSLVTRHAFSPAPLFMGYWGFVMGLITVSMLPQLWPVPVGYPGGAPLGADGALDALRRSSGQQPGDPHHRPRLVANEPGATAFANQADRLSEPAADGVPLARSINPSMRTCAGTEPTTASAPVVACPAALATAQRR
jgi:hypothetical protein